MKFIPTTQEGMHYEGGVINHFLHPGDFFFGESNCQIHTILGSCIAITLWHPILHIGGMCHFVLPGERRFDREPRRKGKLNGRYSDDAMTLFENAAQIYGTNLKEYEAKIFGGSNMLAMSTFREDNSVGLKNTNAALKHLTEKSILLQMAHVGETGYRRIAFELESGDVWVKHKALQKVIPT
jgi:chemotaxis protein CheD